MRRLLSVSGLGIAMLLTAGVGQARATTVLLDLEDPAGTGSTFIPFALPLVATSTSTDVTFAGYQLPGDISVIDIQLTAGGGPNLLGAMWTFTPAPIGSNAAQGPAGAFGTNNFSFMGFVEDRFDQFSQTVTTAVGQTYSLQFRFNNTTPSSPSELLVTTSGAAASQVPEPASLTLFAAGLVGLAASSRRRGQNARV